MTIPVKNNFWRENYFMAGSFEFLEGNWKKTKKIYIYKKKFEIIFHYSEFVLKSPDLKKLS